MSEEEALPAPKAAGRIGERFARPLFILTIVTGSFLLFLTQPMIARMALPRVGWEVLVLFEHGDMDRRLDHMADARK